MKKRLAILASGSGTNAEAIVKYFKDHQQIEVALIATNKPEAGILARAKNWDIETMCFSHASLQDGTFLSLLKEQGIDFLILAGFLLKIPLSIIESYAGCILNIHPSLLPKYGGKGMYGDRVHQSVLNAEEKESGISIHLVNEVYDDGRILLQEKIPVMAGDDLDSLASRIHVLEHLHYAPTIEKYVLSFISGEANKPD